MDDAWRKMVWRQFGAAITMIEKAIDACPDDLWSDRAREPEVWLMVLHALFYLDLYLSETPEGVSLPPPLTDPNGPRPERAFSKDELRSYLRQGRAKCRATIEQMSEERARRRCGFYWLEMTDGELLLYNMRHVQHHAAQLNLVLRREAGRAPGWVAMAPP
jgi:uncharacterized damage-inducible protein DinB